MDAVITALPFVGAGIVGVLALLVLISAPARGVDRDFDRSVDLAAQYEWHRRREQQRKGR